MSSKSKRSLGSRLLPASLHRALQFDRAPTTKWVLEKAILAIKSGDLVLEAGSGAEEEQHTKEPLRATGATIHTSDIARRPGITYVADLHAMPIGDATYDVIICTQVLEHVRHPGKVCAELARMLKPGGHLFLTAPQSAFLHDLPHHYFNYTHYGLRQLLENVGMEVLGFDPQGGHFTMLGIHLHYTARVLRNAMTTPLRKILLFPFLVFVQVVFGFFAKLLFLAIDRLDHEARNTQGWCVRCRKPVTGTTAPKVTGLPY